MTTRTNNSFNRSFLPLSAAVLMGTASASAVASDAQEQARNLLTGVAGESASFPASGNDTMQADPETQAQWLLAGKPQTIGTVANESHKTVVAEASPSELARRLLAGKGS